MPPYNPTFFANVHDGAIRSAKVLLPRVLEWIGPKSIIDVGCGEGSWLSVARELGVEDILGLDGDYVDRGRLLIPREKFRAADLTKPFDVGRRFDLAMSLEVAEHLPPACAAAFVEQLTQLAPVVLFSAAIPFQRGNNHVNEQWPDTWIAHFRTAGFECVDCVRPVLWDDSRVEWWYAQNTFLYVRADVLRARPQLRGIDGAKPAWPVRMVHPRAYQRAIDENELQKELARRMHDLAQDIGAVVREDGAFLLADDCQMEPWAVPPKRVMIPFLEHEGQAWGPPADDAQALAELERMRRTGAQFLVFAWTAFWWLEHYREFIAHVRANFACVIENERAVIFALR